MPWGEPHTRGTGTTGEIEVAHQALDKLGVPSGVLAERVLVLVARYSSAVDDAVQAHAAHGECHEQRDRYKAALERIEEKRRREEQSWNGDRHFPTEHAKDWHDGYITAMAGCALIVTEALDPEGWAEHQEQWQIGSHGTDREWFDATGNCGHCGNPGEDCVCTADDPCGCGPHELRTEPRPCWRCKGTGIHEPTRATA